MDRDPEEASKAKAVLPAETERAVASHKHRERQALLIKALNSRHLLWNRLGVRQCSLSSTPWPSQQLLCDNPQWGQRGRIVTALQINGLPTEEKVHLSRREHREKASLCLTEVSLLLEYISQSIFTSSLVRGTKSCPFYKLVCVCACLTCINIHLELYCEFNYSEKVLMFFI